MPAFRWLLDNDLPKCDDCEYEGRCENVPPWQMDKDKYTKKCPTRYALDAGEDMGFVRWWSDWKTFGWYFDGSQERQPAVYVDVVRELESEYNRMQKLKMEQHGDTA